MPTYEYACKHCGEHLEVVQAFTDDSLTVCPNCGGDLRKVFGSVGIVFKGSGFYKTDSRATSKSSKGSEAASAKSESSNGDSGSTTPAKADKAETAAKTEKAETSAKADKAESKPSSSATESKSAAAAAAS